MNGVVYLCTVPVYLFICRNQQQQITRALHLILIMIYLGNVLYMRTDT